MRELLVKARVEHELVNPVTNEWQPITDNRWIRHLCIWHLKQIVAPSKGNSKTDFAVSQVTMVWTCRDDLEFVNRNHYSEAKGISGLLYLAYSNFRSYLYLSRNKMPIQASRFLFFYEGLDLRKFWWLLSAKSTMWSKTRWTYSIFLNINSSLFKVGQTFMICCADSIKEKKNLGRFGNSTIPRRWW